MKQLEYFTIHHSADSTHNLSNINKRFTPSVIHGFVYALFIGFLLFHRCCYEVLNHYITGETRKKKITTEVLKLGVSFLFWQLLSFTVASSYFYSKDNHLLLKNWIQLQDSVKFYLLVHNQQSLEWTSCYANIIFALSTFPSQ